MLPWSGDLAGRLDELVIDSEVLRGNPLGDPHERPLWVYVPPGYDDDPSARYPTIYVIQGYTGHVAMWGNRSPFRQPFPETADAVFAGGAPPCIVVYVDAWTAYGGSQFVDSPGTGNYHTYLCDEVVPFVDARYRTIADRESRAHHGQVQRRVRRDDHPDAAPGRVRRAGHARRRRAVRAVLRPGVRRTSSARCAPTTATPRAGGRTSPRGPRSPSPRTRCSWASTASRPASRPTPTARPSCRSTRSPACCVPRSGRAGWTSTRSGWRPEHADALRSLRADLDRRRHLGRLLPGHRRPGVPRAELAAAQVPEDRIHFELFPGTHGGIDYRYPLSLEWLAQRLAR